MDKKDKRNKILKVAGLIGLFLIVFGLSYALFTVTLNGTKKVKIKTGKLELQLLDKNNNPIYSTSNNSETSYEINLDNQVPVSDEVGLDSTAFEFKLKNSGNLKASYTIYLDDVALEEGESRIDDQYIRYSLTKNGSEDSAADLTSLGSNPNRELDKGTIDADNTTYTYTLKIWIKESATNEAMDKVFNAKLRVEGTQYVKTGPFDDGTFAATIYNKGIVGEYNTTTNRLSNGFDSESEESGLYKYTDEYNLVTYAYRGLPEDNYVTFANQTWRILRIQEDGTVKLIREYALDYENANYVNVEEKSYIDASHYYYTVKYNNNATDDNSVQYSGSNIEKYLNDWYHNSLENGYNDKIMSNDYCSDRTENTDSHFYKLVGAHFKKMYGAYNRIIFGDWDGTGQPTQQQMSNVILMPSISCRNDDKTTSKVGLITLDEYILAGAGSGQFSIYLVTDNYLYWTMSPIGVYYDNIGQVGDISDGNISGRSVSSTSDAVRPVITLKSNVVSTSGDGTVEHPYVIE